MAIEWIKPGLATMVQATPYRGHRHVGMPLSGAADPVTMALANWIAGNDAETPAMETALLAMSFRARADITVAIAGAADNVCIDGQPQPLFESLYLQKGMTLEIASPKYGCRSYIAVSGGFSAESIFDGNSTYMPAPVGGSAHNPPQAGSITRLATENPVSAEERALSPEYCLKYGNDFLLRICAGPEANLLTDAGSAFNIRFVVGRRADRIGIELEGAEIALGQATDMQSSAVFPGTVQCPPSGKPFLLGPDAQTSGGYPRIANVIRADRHLIGQLRPGARLTLQSVSPAEARSLYRSKLELLRKLQPGLRLD